MDNSSKKIVLAFSLLPILAWVATLVYFLYINNDLIATRTFQNHDAVVTNIINHFLPFTILLSFAELVTGLMICYYVVHIARLKNLDAFQKLGYIIFLVFLGPIAVLVTWFIEVRKEPLNIDMYPNVG
jgi:ABC-type dipeptide/oligopeptide/nickel transport system permease component